MHEKEKLADWSQNHQKYQLLLSAQPSTWFFQTCGVHNIRALWMTASSCRAWSLLPPGHSFYCGPLSLCDIQLRSPFPAPLYSTCVLPLALFCMPALWPAQRVLPRSLLLSWQLPAEPVQPMVGCCIHLLCHSTLTWGQRFLSARGILPNPHLFI